MTAFGMPFGDTVTVWTEERDRKFGDTKVTGERQLGPVGLYPEQSAEPDNDQREATVTTTMVMLVPTGHGLTAHHRVKTPDGRVWRVRGEPGDYRSPLTNWAPGGTVTLERTTG